MIKTEDFNYEISPELIAQKPTHPRDSARVLVYDRKNETLSFDIFKNLGKYLPKNAILVFNQTRVLPARLPVLKPTGGKVELLYLGTILFSPPYQGGPPERTRRAGVRGGMIKALSNKKLTLNSILTIPIKSSKSRKILSLTVVKKDGGTYFLKPNFDIKQFPQILKKYGQTPLPPYIKHSPLTEKQKQKAYQTVFAKTGESVAAPTASLHFTKKLLTDLKKQGIVIKFVRLDVSLGTFAPLTPKQLKTGKLHTEQYFIDPKTIEFIVKAKKQKRPIFAVGTTSLRTLESYAQTKKLSGTTDLFIYPPYEFKLIDGLITNFHVPKSSLMMLVSALVGRKKLLDIYQKAMEKQMRFFSFGDGMLIL